MMRQEDGKMFWYHVRLKRGSPVEAIVFEDNGDGQAATVEAFKALLPCPSGQATLIRNLPAPRGTMRGRIRRQSLNLITAGQLSGR
jgi:hypothetical protein